MTYTLTITDGVRDVYTETHDNLRDARAALIRYQNRNGLHFTVHPWRQYQGRAIQDGVLRTGMQIFGTWAISYPLEEKVSA